MLILAPLCIAVVSFVAGSFLVFKGYQEQEREAPSLGLTEPDVVPIEDPNEIDEFKNQFAGPEETPSEPPVLSNDGPRPTLGDVVLESETPEPAPEVETAERSDEQKQKVANLAQIEELKNQVDQLTYQLRDQEENMRAQAIQFTEENKAIDEKLQEALEKNKTLENAALESDSLGAQGAAKFFAVEEELRKIKAENERLTEELKIRDEQIDEQPPETDPTAGAELEGLKADVARLTEDLKAKEERIIEQQREMILQEADRDDSPDMQLQLKSAEEMAQRLTEENSRLGQELQQKDARIIALQNEMDELKNMPAPPVPEESGTADADAAAAAGARIEVLDQQLQELRDAMDELAGAKRNLEEQLREREQELLTVNSEADIFKSQIREEQTHQKNKMEALQQEIDAEKERIHEQRQADIAMIETLKNENQALQDAGAGYQQRIDSLAEELKQIQEEHARAVQQHDSLAGQQDHSSGELQEQLRQREQQLADWEAKFREAEEASSKKVQDLTEEIERVRQSALESAQAAPQAETESAVSEAELNTLREQAKKMGEKEKLLVYELSKSKAQIMGLEKICEDFKRQLEQGR